MTQTLRIALCQMTSGDTHAVNQAALEAFAAQAAAEGAHLLALPEVAGLMNRNVEAARPLIVAAADDPFLATAREAAARHGLWIHAGSTPVAGAGGKFRNHSVLVAPSGKIVAEYDKIHLFDVFLEDHSPTGESSRFIPGDRAVLVDTPWGPWGLSICYDLRFPHLYRAYGQAGATVIFIPSAFTVPTGRAHWEVLLRARAIENGAFVVAPAQVGHHADGRQTWGHSMVVSPWGEVLEDMGGTAPGLALVDLDLGLVRKARAQVPSLKHDRAFSLTRMGGET